MEPWLTFDRFLADELELAELEQWVYATPTLEVALLPAEYLALVSLAYGGRHALHEAKKLVTAIYEAHRPGRLPYDRARRLAEGMLAGTINVAAGTRALAAIYYDDQEWIPIAFVGIASELDTIPEPKSYARWDPRALAERLREARDQERYYRAPALTAARRLLEYLDTLLVAGL